MVRLVLRLSRIGRIAAITAAIGAMISIYGRLSDANWATLTGGLMLFFGAMVYLVERLRALMKRSD